MSLKNAKLSFIVDVAIQLFLSRSIMDVTIKDIADKAEVGEATIYRYFKKKHNIVLAACMKLQDNIRLNYFNMDAGKNGFEKIQIFYNSYYKIFIDSPKHFKFIKEFDSYMADEGITLDEYEKSIDEYKNAFIAAYEEGLKDKSIASIDDIDLFYFSTTHSLLELCKKSAVDKELLSQDKSLKKGAEIAYLINIFLKKLQNS